MIFRTRTMLACVTISEAVYTPSLSQLAIYSSFELMKLFPLPLYGSYLAYLFN